jgi:hypothetical protein
MRPYRLIPVAERNRTLDHEADLLSAAIEARREGWQPWEFDPVAAAARRLDVAVWPALRARILREARESAALVGC